MNYEVGIAHFKRAIRLAESLEEKNLKCEIIFVLRYYESTLIKKLKYKKVFINDEADILELIEKEDIILYDVSHKYILKDLTNLKEVFNFLNSIRVKIIMYDGVTLEDSVCKNIMLTPDFLVVPYLNVDKSQYFLGKNTKFLSGIEYFVFDKEILKIKKENLTKEDYILISFGGSDVCGITVKVIKILSNMGYNLKVVYSESFSEKDINEIHRLKSPTIDIYKEPKNFFRLLKSAKLLITSIGLTKYEAFYLSVPVLVVSDNNYMEEEHRALISYGLCYIGNITTKKIHQKVGQLLTNESSLYTFNMIDLKDIFVYV